MNVDQDKTWSLKWAENWFGAVHTECTQNLIAITVKSETRCLNETSLHRTNQVNKHKNVARADATNIINKPI